MTGKLASMSASLAAKVMVNSCPSMAGTFLLLVSGGIPPFLEYCMPDATVPASLLSPRLVGKKVDARLQRDTIVWLRDDSSCHPRPHHLDLSAAGAGRLLALRHPTAGAGNRPPAGGRRRGAGAERGRRGGHGRRVAAGPGLPSSPACHSGR